MATQGQWLGDWPGEWFGAESAQQSGARSLLAFWAGGAVAGVSPTQAGVRGLLAPWIGGAASVEAGEQVSSRSLLAFWIGGAVQGEEDVQIPAEASGGIWKYRPPVEIGRTKREPSEPTRSAEEVAAELAEQQADALRRDVAAARAIEKQLSARRPQAVPALSVAIAAAEAAQPPQGFSLPAAADSAKALAASKADAVARLEAAKKARNRLRAAMLAALLLMQ